MTNPRPSIRLKQISRLISRQKTEDEEGSVISSSCLSIVIILIIIFLTGVAMLTAGASMVESCDTWLPIWLVVEGSSLLALCLVMFCGHSQTGILSIAAKVIFVILILVNIWCSVGIFWTAENNECGHMFGLVVKCLFAGSFIVVSVTYWCGYNFSEDAKNKQRKSNRINQV